MELNKALKIVLELAEQNVINDPEMALEMQDQWNAAQTVRMHLTELQSPSPVQIVIDLTDASQEDKIVYGNVPFEMLVIDKEFSMKQIVITQCNPQHVAKLIGE